MTSRDTCFLVSFNMVHSFENVCESTKVFWIIIKQVKALKKVKQELVTTKIMKKQETKRVLDNLKMPKQQEIFTTVAIVFHSCIIALPVLENVSVIILL